LMAAFCAFCPVMKVLVMESVPAAVPEVLTRPFCPYFCQLVRPKRAPRSRSKSLLTMTMRA